MKEILYIQAGALANYTGTHFWNTQECYFTYGDDEDPIVNHDISFREGLSDKSEPTFCPRLLMFDRKANFGTLSQSNALLDSNTDSDNESSLWNGDVAEFRQNPVPKSQYHERLEDDLEDEVKQASASEIRYWSDFNRVYYHPRTIQQLPNAVDWETTDGDWDSGKEAFGVHNKETSLMEDSFRLFVEECDSLQGIQILNDTATFGAFTDSFLCSFRDEFLKTPSLTFPLLSNAIPGDIDLDNASKLGEALNDALCLRGLNELSTMSIPIQAPSTWSECVSGCNLNVDIRSMYQTSSILSAHIESATLPLRLKLGAHDLASFCAHLDWRGSTRFGQLSGIFPVTSTLDFDQDIYNFSAMGKDVTQFSRTDVLRGFSESTMLSFDTWRAHSALRGPSVQVRAPAYPLPDSFPLIFTSPPSMPPALKTQKGIMSTPSAPMFSSVATSTQTSTLFEKYALFIEDCLKRRPAMTFTVEKDEMRELGSDLWTLRDNFAEMDATGE